MKLFLVKHVSKLVFGVMDLDFGVRIDSNKQPIQRNSVDSEHVSHRRAFSLYNHFAHSLILFKNEQLGFEMRRFCPCDNVIHIRQSINFSVTFFFDLLLVLVLCI